MFLHSPHSEVQVTIVTAIYSINFFFFFISRVSLSCIPQIRHLSYTSSFLTILKNMLLKCVNNKINVDNTKTKMNYVGNVEKEMGEKIYPSKYL